VTLASLLVPAIRWDAAHGFDYLADHIDDALEIGVGGFVISGGPRHAVATLTADLHARSRVPLLLAADVECGAGQQFEGCTEFPPFGAVGSLGDLAAARRAVRIAAREMKQLGLNWALAPVCDLDTPSRGAGVGSRNGGADPAFVAALVAECIDACQAEGVLACAKRYAALGTARDASLEVLQSASDAGVASLMLAEGMHGTLAPLYDAGFDGLIVTGAFDVDARIARAAELDTAVRAIASGYDVLLAPADPLGVARALDRAVQHGTISADRARAATEIRDRWAQWGRPAPGRDTPMDDVMWSRQLADRCVHMLRGDRPLIGDALQIVEVRDDPVESSPRDHAYFASALHALGIDAQVVAAPTAGTRVPLIVAVFGAKNHALIAHILDRAAAQHRESLVVLFTEPREVAQLPPTCSALCAWSPQRTMQESAARTLVR
jgi:beta-glucosidase-like glycosyl hydrolase